MYKPQFYVSSKRLNEPTAAEAVDSGMGVYHCDEAEQHIRVALITSSIFGYVFENNDVLNKVVTVLVERAFMVAAHMKIIAVRSSARPDEATSLVC